MIQSIHSVHIYVANQTVAVRYYKDVFGFEVRRWEPLGPAGSWIEMGPPGSKTSMVIYPKDAMPDADTRKAMIMFDVEDINATFEYLANKGVTFTQEPTSIGWAVMALFNDPDGNTFALIQATKAPTIPHGVAGLKRPGGSGGPPPPPPPPPGA
jgi:predicted enzyme related to lactoylglutathione lyase